MQWAIIFFDLSKLSQKYQLVPCKEFVQCSSLPVSGCWYAPLLFVLSWRRVSFFGPVVDSAAVGLIVFLSLRLV